jgi:hypothetical protein
MNKGAWLFIPLLLCSASIASAGPITYDVTVDTSSISGTAGSFDFQFNPGPLVTQAASLQILNFASNGALAANPVLTGNVNRTLPGTLTFDNGTAFNDYFEGFTYGSTLSFEVSLDGPALTSPDGVSSSGSTFAFSMFSDAAGTTPALTTNSAAGFAFTIDVNLDGTTTLANYSSQTMVVPITSAIPEPSTIALLGIGLIGLGIMRRRRATKHAGQHLVFSCASGSASLCPPFRDVTVSAI